MTITAFADELSLLLEFDCFLLMVQQNFDLKTRVSTRQSMEADFEGGDAPRGQKHDGGSCEQQHAHQSCSRNARRECHRVERGETTKI